MENWDNINIALLKHQKDLEDKTKKAESLFVCIKADDKEGARMLFKSGCHVNCFTEDETALTVCLEHNRFEMATFLIGLGANPFFRPNFEFQDAFWKCLILKNYDFLRLFVRSCKSFLRNKDGESILINLVKDSDEKGVEIVLENKKIKVNEIDISGNTALHHNMLKQPPEQADLNIGRMLLAAGADVNSVNHEGKTPKEMAEGTDMEAVLMMGSFEQKYDNIQEPVADDLDIGLDDVTPPPAAPRRPKI